MGDSIEFNSRRSPVLGSKAGASTDQPLASAAAIEVLQKGGNAADAAVAAAAVLQVLQPYATGIGGDCFCIFYNASDKSVRSIDGSGKSPAQLTLELLRSRGFDEKHLPDDNSGLTATVPGAVKGWFDTVENFGSKKVTMEDILEPAIRYAESGFPVAPMSAVTWEGLEDKLKGMHGGHTFLPSGRAPRSGDVLRNLALAKVLKTLGQKGPAAFYEGPVAQAVVNAVAAAGGVLSLQDLKNHLESSEDPVVPTISTTYRGVRVHTMRPPSHGAVLLEALNILEAYDLKSYGKTSGEYYHLLIEALRLAFADGLSCLSSPGHYSLTSVINMTCKKHAEDRRAFIDTKRAMDKVAASDLLAPPQFHTTFLTTVDEHGNACAFINSNFKLFGCTIVEEHGFAVHSRAMGFVGVDGHPNCVGPLKKPYHTLMPVMVTDSQSGDWMANIGCMGGYGQPQVNLQVLLGMLELGLNPQEAVDRPRVLIGQGYSFHQDDGLVLEEGLPSDVAQELKKRGHRLLGTFKGALRRRTGFAHVVTRGSWWNRSGGSPSCTEGRDTFLWFGSDPRSDGAAMAY
ncbi:glutathione hydrolase-like YwrD proenzyme [Ixodes scapularis]|uniref:glutathione hydrolase-like YwrD proenzyme n=1 Tax=Ixodes scapularis TaxID=6945 RepID=UPI001C37F0C7|nr:glutathione hydrolase-like YwrD proenzyme [Ixodes scapularis]